MPAKDTKSSLSRIAYQVLRTLFAVTPIITGIDKFFNSLTNWGAYLNPAVGSILPCSTQLFMRILGVIEIAAGILVAFKPRIGGIVISVWLLGIVINLSFTPGFYDIALRDFGLSLAALSLALLSGECACK